MQQSFTKNYIYIYLFQFLSILLGFASMFVVVPSLSANPNIYGIYAVCTSIMVFLSYADLGFLGAGTKFAAEYYAREERDKELEVVGFSHFILLVIVCLISLVFLVISFHPSWLIKDIPPGKETEVAHALLLILALFSPTIVLQRMVQMLFNIRLQDYKVQRVIIVGNLIKIASVFVFFSNGRYDIVGYYLTFNLINVVVVVVNLLQARQQLNIRFIEILKNIRFNRTVFSQVNKLAYSTMIGTILWVVFYELDSIVIGRLLGASAVASYAIGLTMLGFLRSLLGVFFAPFSARFNHLVGLKQEEQLKRFYYFVLQIMFFVVVIPIMAVAIMSKSITISWVGWQYQDSIPIVTMLVLCNILAFVNYPCGSLIVSLQDMKKIYQTNIILPVVYWGGVGLTVSAWGIYAFPCFKLMAFMVVGLYYCFYSIRFLGVSVTQFVRTVLVPYIPAMLLTMTILIPCRGLFMEGKSGPNLFLCGTVIIGSIGVSFMVSMLANSGLRAYCAALLKKILSIS